MTNAAHVAGHPAPYGLYYSTSPFDVRFVGAEGETLEGRAPRYRRIPTPIALALSPVLGGIFVAAFPILILAAVTYAAYSKLMATADENAFIAQARFQPAATFHKGTENTDRDDAPEELDELVAEVETKRDGEAGRAE